MVETVKILYFSKTCSKSVEKFEQFLGISGTVRTVSKKSVDVWVEDFSQRHLSVPD